MIDYEVRQQALNPQHSFIMEAPAGSGKTEVLVRRVLSLLLVVEHPRNILAITFTRKAAAEMKARLFDALKINSSDPIKAKLIHDVKARIVEKNWMDTDLEALNIMTIDALCARILNTDARVIDVHAEMIPDYRVLGDALMFELLEHLEAHDDYAPMLRTLFLYFGNNIEKVKNLLLKILEERSEWLSVLVSRKYDAAHLQQELETNIKVLYENLFLKWQKLEPRVWVQDVNAWLGGMTAQDIKKIANLLLTKQGDLRKRFDARLGLNPELKSAYQDLVTSLLESDHVDTWLTLLNEIQMLPPLKVDVSPVVTALVALLPLIAAHWQILLREHHYRDFQEEALQAVLNLTSNDPVSNALLRFERELKHILVDEFQDTSALQFRLLELMTQTWEMHDGRTLFLVGDPMQSIYRFRHAKVELFLEAKDQGLGRIKFISLRLIANFRTDPKIMEFINAHLSRAFPRVSDVLTGAVPFTPSHAERHYDDAEGVVTSCFDSPEQEAEALTNKIKTLLAKDADASIAILARSRTHLKKIMTCLSMNNLPIVAENWGSLFEAQIILDVMSLTCAITHLGDRLSWMALLRSPLLKLNLDELLVIALASRERTIFEVLQDEQVLSNFNLEVQARINNFIAIITPAIFDAELLLLTRVKKVFDALSVEYQFTVLEENLLMQYWQFLAMVPIITSRREFLENLQRLKLNYVSDGARITLLTIHQAKGLEFDYVFLPHLNQGVRRDDPPLLRWQELHSAGQFRLLLGLHKNAEGDEDFIYKYLSYLAKAENAYEQVRLLYVALTRAKKGLYLSYFKDEDKEFKVKAGSFLKLLNLFQE